MRRVFYQIMVSLDGFIDGPMGAWDIDWHTVDVNFDDYATNMLASVDGFLMGRRTYEGFARYWPGSTDAEAAAMNELPKIVFSNTLDKVEWNNSRLVRGDAAEEVARLKQESGKDLAIFSNSLASSLAQAGLIDEYRFFVNPLVLGGGTPALKGINDRLNLRLLKTETLSSGVVLLSYEPAIAS